MSLSCWATAVSGAVSDVGAVKGGWSGLEGSVAPFEGTDDCAESKDSRVMFVNYQK